MDLMTLLPPIYNENSTMKQLQSILSNDINTLASSFNKTIDECFINTATSLLSRYEKIYGLAVDVSKSDMFRRERITAKVRGIGTVTKQMIIDTAAAYSNGEVEVIEIPETYSFKIKFIGTKGIPPNMADLTITLEEIKPAHLSFIFEFIYRTHAELTAYTHNQLSEYTHAEVKEGVM
jgi:uncharacterized protein YmfQ (DUF2313 family)